MCNIADFYRYMLSFPQTKKKQKLNLLFGGSLEKKHKSVWEIQEHEDIWSATRLAVVEVVHDFLQNGKSPDSRTVHGETP